MYVHRDILRRRQGRTCHFDQGHSTTVGTPLWSSPKTLQVSEDAVGVWLEIGRFLTRPETDLPTPSTGKKENGFLGGEEGTHGLRQNSVVSRGQTKSE